MISDNVKKWALVLVGCFAFLLLRVVWLAHEKGRFHGIQGIPLTCQNTRRQLREFTLKHIKTAPGKPVTQEEMINAGFPIASLTCKLGGTLSCRESSARYMWKCSKCTPLEIKTNRMVAEVEELNQKPLLVLKNGLSKLSIREVLWLDRVRLW